MKKTTQLICSQFGLALAAVLLLGAPLTLRAACTTTPSLLNPSFENYPCTTANPDNWGTFTVSGSITMAKQTATPQAGTSFIWIVPGSAGSSGGVYQNITAVNPGSKYNISGYMRPNSGLNIRGEVRLSPNASGATYASASTIATQTSTTYAWFGFGTAVIASGTSMTLWLDGYQTTGSGKTMAFDNFGVSCGGDPTLSYSSVPSSGTVGSTFSVTVQSKDANGTVWNLPSSTTITLTKGSGSGTLGGTTTGTLSGGSSSVTISGVTYNTAEGMTLTATASGGLGYLTPVTSGTITFSSSAANLNWGSADANWTAAGAWYNTGTSGYVSYSAGDNVTLADANSGTGDRTITLTGTVSPGSVTCSAASKNFTISGTGGVISGGTGLTKSGAGTLTLSTANTFTGAVGVSGGTLIISSTSALNASATTAVTISGGATVRDNETTGGYYFPRTGALNGVSLVIGTGGGTVDLGSSTSAIAIEGAVISGTDTLTMKGAGEFRTYVSHNTFPKLIVDGALFTAGHASTAGYYDSFCAGPASTTPDAITLQNGGAIRSAVGVITLDAKQGITLGTSGTGIGIIRGYTGSGLTIPGVITGSGALQIGVSGSVGTVTLNGANTFTGNTTIAGSTLQLGNNLALQNSIFDPSGGIAPTFTSGITTPTFGGLTSSTALAMPSTITSLTLNPGASQNPSYGGNLSGGTSMALIKNGAGTQTFTSANSYTGGTTLNVGTLTFSALNNLGSSGGITFGGGTLQWASGNTADISARTVALGTGGGTFDVQANNVALANAIGNSGAGGLTKAGTGTLTLSGANTFTGGVTINLGEVIVNNAGALNSSTPNAVTFPMDTNTKILSLNGNTITVSGLTLPAITGGTATVVRNNHASTDATLTINVASGTYTYAGSMTDGSTAKLWVTKTGAGTLFLGGGGVGSFTYSGDTRITAGTLKAGGSGLLPYGATAGDMIVNGTLDFDVRGSEQINGLSGSGTVIRNGSSGTCTFTLGNRDANASFSGAIKTGLGEIALVKTGSGTQVLSGTSSTYAGGTTVSGGTLLVSNASGSGTGSGTVSVSSTATFGGTGTVSGAVTYNSGALASFTVTSTGGGANTTPMTFGALNVNSTVVHVALPSGLPSGLYTLATYTGTIGGGGTVNSSPVVDSGSLATGTTGTVSVDATNHRLLLTVNAGPLDHFAVSNPGTVTAGSPFTTTTITAQDANNNTVIAFTGTVDLTETGNGAGGAVSPATSGAFTLGVLAGPSLTLTKAATSGVTLTAYDHAGTGKNGTSPGFTVNPGTAAKLALTTQPSGGTGGTAWTTQPVVTVQDANGNTVTTDTSTVTVAIQNNAGPGGVLSGTATEAAVNGVANFTGNGLKIDKIGTGYTLRATDGSLTYADTSGFNITVGAAAKLAFTTQPSGGTGGTAWTTQPVVTVQDAGGNTVTTDTSTVTVAIQNNAGPGGVLSGTATEAAVNGVANFTGNGLKIDKIGTGYTLRATDGSLTYADSSGFNVTVGAAAKLAFTTQPSGGTGGTAWTTQPVVTVQDAGGNTVTTDTSTVTVAIQNNAGPGGVLSGTATEAAVNGVANFTGNGLKIDKIGTGYTLRATDGSLTYADSSGFNVTVGAAAKLAFTTQPGGGTGGTAWTTQPVVTVQDAGGNTVTTDTSTVTVAIQNNAGPGGVLSGTATEAAVNGVANFTGNGLKIDKIGTGYTLRATDGSLTYADSSGFNVTVGAAAKLAFTTQPGGGTGGTAWTTQPVVTVQDAGGNTVTTDTSTVTVAIQNNAGPGGVLSGTATEAAVNGVADFSGNGLKIDKIGTAYTLTATDDSLTSATSSGFDITVGAAAKLAFGVQPTTTSAGSAISPAVTVIVQDAGGNTVTSDSSSVTISSSTTAFTGDSTLVTNASGGVAAFDTIKPTTAGSANTLTASDDSLTGATSSTFTVNSAATSGNLDSSPNPSLPGADVTFTATVTNLDAGGLVPSGTVTFKTNGVALCDPIDLNGSGVATLITNSLPHGSNTVTAEFAGDSTFLGLTNSVVQVVNTPPTTTNCYAGVTENQALVLSVVKLLKTAQDDDDGDSLSVIAADPTSTNGPASNVVLSTNAGVIKITYTPATDYTGLDSFTYVVSDNYGGTVTPTVFVTVTGTNVPSPNVVIPPTITNGHFYVGFAGIPGYNYTIQWRPDADSGSWTTITNLKASTNNGLFEFVDPTEAPLPPSRYYRTIYP